jgi:diguanylate cyclase (GGDEF)-like protein
METWEQALRQLRGRFVRGSPERLGRIAICLERLEKDRADTATLSELRKEFHNLSGLGTTYGFPRVTRLGLRGEAACNTLRSAGATPLAEDLDACRKILDELREQFTAAESDRGPEAHTDIGTPKRPDILIVQDDPEFLEAVSQFGEKDGLQMRAVSNHAQAVSEINRQMPDGALVDVDLPDGSGYELVEYLRGLPGGESAAVLILGGRTGFLDRVEAIHCGADGCFQKPVDWEALSRRLHQLLERSRGEPPHVLSVEDDPEQAAYLRTVLELAGYEVRTISDPRQFEAALISFHPDLVLMDILLPEVSGYDLAQYLRQDERYATLPVLFLSTEEELQVRIRAIKAGGDEHLVKPVTPALLLSTVAARIERARFVKDLLDRDGLTRLLTHTAFLERARAVLARAQRQRVESSALVMLDLDHFKAVNDCYGHPVGDRVLASLSSLLRRRLRQSDIIGRLGGEEFAVILEDMAGEDAARLMERILRDFSELEHRASNGATFRATFSAGVAALEPAVTDLNRWLASADAALYAAKAAGRNRIVSASRIEP